MDSSLHWDNVYSEKPFDSVSWYAPHLDESLRIIYQLAQSRDAAIVDIGGGESTLVDDLLDNGYGDVTVLDISETAIRHTQGRLGPRSVDVSWYVGNVTTASFEGKQFDVWHDRAVFHFLTDDDSRRAYVDLVRRSVKPGGFVVMATFGPQGPLKCSGLDVVRYSDEELHSEFGDEFQLLGSDITDHSTPGGANQQFMYCWCRLEH